MTLPTTTGRHASKPTRGNATRIIIAALVCLVTLIPTGLSAVATEGTATAAGDAESSIASLSSDTASQASNITPPQQSKLLGSSAAKFDAGASALADIGTANVDAQSDDASNPLTRGTVNCVEDSGFTVSMGNDPSPSTGSPGRPGFQPIKPGSSSSLGGSVKSQVNRWGTFCAVTATNTIQFRYSTGGATQGDSSQTIFYDAHTDGPNISFSAIDTQVNTTQPYKCSYNGSVYYTGNVTVPSWSGTICSNGRPSNDIACNGGHQSLDPDDPTLGTPPDTEDQSPSTLDVQSRATGTAQLQPNTYCTSSGRPRKCYDYEGNSAHLILRAPIVSVQCPAATAFDQYRLNGGGGSAGMPAYNRVYVPDINGYDVSVSNGSWDPNSRTVAMPQPVNSAGTPVYGTNLQTATDAVTTVIYTRPAASLTVHYTKNGVEDTSLQQVFNGYRGDAITTANKALNVPNGYYIDSGTPPLTCTDTSCTLPANTAYPAGHTDYWITCWKTVPKHESWNATLIVHYKDDQGNTLHPDQTKTVTITRDYTTRPDTGTSITDTGWTYPGNDPTVIWGTVDETRKILIFTIDSPTIPNYHTNQPTVTCQTGVWLNTIADGGNDTKEVTVTYHRTVTALPFTGGTATAATVAFIGAIIAAVLLTVTLVLKHKQHHIATN